jgi:hypothetical protein
MYHKVKVPFSVGSQSFKPGDLVDGTEGPNTLIGIHKRDLIKSEVIEEEPEPVALGPAVIAPPPVKP